MVAPAPQRRRRLRRAVGAATLAATLAVSGTAIAGDGYVVTLHLATDSCDETITAVTSDHGVSADARYTASFCGFTATMSKRRAERVAADPRVASMTINGSASAG